MKSYSLSRPERITKTSEFKPVFKNGVFYSGRFLKLCVARNKYGISRIGVSLRREYFKLAVARNRLRRQIKESFRLNKQNFLKGYDIIVIPKPGCAGIEFDKLSGEFIELIKKAGILNRE